MATNDDGQTPTALTPEEIQVLQEKAQKAEDLSKQIEEKEKELVALRDKDLNITRFRHKTEEEKKSLMAKMSEEQKALTIELEESQKERDSDRKERMDDAKDRSLQKYAGNDTEMRKKIEIEMKDLYSAAGEPKNAKELEDRYTKAWKIVASSNKSINAIHGYSPTNSYNEPRNSDVPFAESESGKATYKSLFGHLPGELNK